MPATQVRPLDLTRLRKAVAETDAALRLRVRLQPAGGRGDKVFPPTYAGAVYANEDRRINGKVVPTVLLDSVQSQANRLEEALKEAHESGVIRLPIVAVDFARDAPEAPRSYTTLDVPHRIFDAILRDSLLGDTPFPDTEVGRRVAAATAQDATALFEFCPTALLFGAWDSTGARGGLGNKFARALVSEIIAVDAVTGCRTGGRLDPTGIRDLKLYKRADASPKNGDYTPLVERAATEQDRKDKSLKPVPYGKKASELNLSNVTPDLVRAKEEVRTANKKEVIVKQDERLPGGVTMDYALQTTVLSLPALRKLRFPDGSKGRNPDRDTSARTVLAALGLAAVALQLERGYSLRSRCNLAPRKTAFELVRADGTVEPFALPAGAATALLNEAVAEAAGHGLRWAAEPVTLRPKPALVELVKKSREVTPEAEGDA
jgi:CRISPR-associated protein Csb1